MNRKEAKDFHERWLKKHNVHPDQIKKRPKHKNKIPSYKTEKFVLSNTVANGFKTGIMETLHLEAPHIQRAILDKAARVAPLYNKGGYQFVTDGIDIKTIGSKSKL